MFLLLTYDWLMWSASFWREFRKLTHDRAGVEPLQPGVSLLQVNHRPDRLLSPALLEVDDKETVELLRFVTPYKTPGISEVPADNPSFKTSIRFQPHSSPAIVESTIKIHKVPIFVALFLSAKHIDCGWFRKSDCLLNSHGFIEWLFHIIPIRVFQVQICPNSGNI